MGSKTHSTSISSEQRHRMIAEAAYFRAEHNGFASDSIEDWLEAETEIDRLLMRQDSPRSKAESKHSLQRRLEEQLMEWDEKLEELTAAAKQAGTKLNKEIHAQLQTLAQKRSVAQHKLVELRDHSADAWDEVHEGAEQLLDDLRSSIGKLTTRLKKSGKDETTGTSHGK